MLLLFADGKFDFVQRVLSLLRYASVSGCVFRVMRDCISMIPIFVVVCGILVSSGGCFVLCLCPCFVQLRYVRIVVGDLYVCQYRATVLWVVGVMPLTDGSCRSRSRHARARVRARTHTHARTHTSKRVAV